jgi:hypothetical protein
VWPSIAWALTDDQSELADHIEAKLRALLKLPQDAASVGGSTGTRDVFFHQFNGDFPTVKVDFHLGRKVRTYSIYAHTVHKYAHTIYK